MAFYDKSGLGYHPSKSFIIICHDKKKINSSMFKCNYCRKLYHLEPLCYAESKYLR